MQLSANTEIWLRALAIGAPAISAAVVAVISYEIFEKTQRRFRELEEFYNEKRIYFDQETQKYMELLTAITRTLYIGHPVVQREIEQMKIEDPEQADQSNMEARKLIQQIRLLMGLLEDRFKELLETEMPASSAIQQSAASAGMSKGE